MFTLFSSLGSLLIGAYSSALPQSSLDGSAGHDVAGSGSGGSDGAGGTSFLDHEAPIAAFAGKTFLRDNIPYIDIPDPVVQDVYYYRWTALQRNLRYVAPGVGYMVTEFVHPVAYAKAFGTIVAAAGHHVDEARWLRDNAYADDYIRLYTRGPADPLQYTQWLLDAAARRAAVTGDTAFLADQLDDMVRVWHLWDPVFDQAAGLYYYQPVWDAQEFALPGYVADPNATDYDLRKDGPDTFRPSHNAYDQDIADQSSMVANARAVARAANLASNGEVEAQFTQLADDLENAMYARMWAADQQFFMDIIRPDNPDLVPLSGREEVGVFPFRFGIGLENGYAQPAVDALFDSEGLYAPWGPTTLERRNEWFMAVKPDDYCCYWNGMSWPFSTAHTLKSLAAIYRSGTTNLTAEQYYEYLSIYARTQQRDGHPYVAESHYPLQDAWSADSPNHSEHYAHSTNNDDVITGLFGIIPQLDDSLEISPIVPDNWTYFALENLPYHGHLVTVLYDQDGTRYNAGAGLTVFVDGAQVHNSASKNASISIPAPVLLTGNDDARLINIAANPTGSGSSSSYPVANATYANPGDDPYNAIDGVLYYDDIPNNRWTNYLSPNANDTLTITFARPRTISSVTLALYSDVEFGRNIDLPSKIEIYGSSGLLVTVSAADDDDGTTTTSLLPNDLNEITLPEPVDTDFVAVNLFRRSENVYVGICELQIWVAAPSVSVSGPPASSSSYYYYYYYAVDAQLSGSSTRVSFDPGSSTATPNGAVVAMMGPSSDDVVAFSGIIITASDTTRTRTLVLSYANDGAETVRLGIEVNQVGSGGFSFDLAPTVSGDYANATAEVALAVGANYVSLRGVGTGDDGASGGVVVRLESLTVMVVGVGES
ncbi:Six-hairpin glycosidase-like protein [Xylariomycetidae sp. FL2044]|nr:Six-hairpin glycosidase-like protein [Xylariomycetidae sp. FL2044]